MMNTTAGLGLVEAGWCPSRIDSGLGYRGVITQDDVCAESIR